jgi:hypothetical protein
MQRVLSFIRAVIGLAFLALLLIPFVGPPLYVELAGVGASGAVVAKREVIDILTDTWTRRLFVDVRYQPADAPEMETTDIAVDAATFDRLRVGVPVQIRYIPNPTLRLFGNLAMSRLETQRPFESFIARLGSVLIGLMIGIAIWLALLLAWSRWRRWWLMLPLVAMMIGGVIYIGSGWPAPAPPGDRAAASATVRATHRVDRVWGGRRTPAEDAVQPYTIVQLSFTPAGAIDPVVGVDMIDADSVPALEMGATVMIRYSVVDPRWVQIDGANRTYYWKNLRTFAIIAAIIAIFFFAAWGARWWRAARRSRAATP